MDSGVTLAKAHLLGKRFSSGIARDSNGKERRNNAKLRKGNAESVKAMA